MIVCLTCKNYGMSNKAFGIGFSLIYGDKIKTRHENGFGLEHKILVADHCSLHSAHHPFNIGTVGSLDSNFEEKAFCIVRNKLATVLNQLKLS